MRSSTALDPDPSGARPNAAVRPSPSGPSELDSLGVLVLGLVASTIVAVVLPLLPNGPSYAAAGEGSLLVATVTAAGMVLQTAKRRGAWLGTRMVAVGLGVAAVAQAGGWLNRSFGRGPPNGDLFAATVGVLLLMFLATSAVDFFEHIREGRAELLSDVFLLSTLAGAAVFLVVHEGPGGASSAWAFTLTAFVAACAILLVAGYGVLTLWCPTPVHVGLFSCATLLSASAIGLGNAKYLGWSPCSLVGPEAAACLSLLGLAAILVVEPRLNAGEPRPPRVVRWIRPTTTSTHAPHREIVSRPGRIHRTTRGGVRAGGGGPGVTGHPGLGGPEHRAGRGGVRHRRPSHPVEPDRHRAVVPRPRGCPGRAGIRHRVASSRRRRGEVLGGTLEVAAGRRRGRRGGAGCTRDRRAGQRRLQLHGSSASGRSPGPTLDRDGHAERWGRVTGLVARDGRGCGGPGERGSVPRSQVVQSSHVPAGHPAHDPRCHGEQDCGADHPDALPVPPGPRRGPHPATSAEQRCHRSRTKPHRPGPPRRSHPRCIRGVSLVGGGEADDGVRGHRPGSGHGAEDLRGAGRGGLQPPPDNERPPSAPPGTARAHPRRS